MVALGSIFLDFNLPNSTTWFYFSLLLAMALFFKFSRLLSVRNWDVLTLFLLVPGLLFLQEGHTTVTNGPDRSDGTRRIKDTGQPVSSPGMGLSSGSTSSETSDFGGIPPARLLWFGYVWLLCGSAYFLSRCLMDLTLVRRPALGPNLNFGGLAWLGVALFVCLTAVAARRPPGTAGIVGKQSAAVLEAQKRAQEMVKQGTPVKDIPGVDTGFLVECTSAMICHLAIAIGLTLIGWRHFQDVQAGMAMATFYLLLPYTAYLVDQVHLVLPAAFLVWAVFAYRRPTIAGLLLGLATGTGYFPALLFPVWLSFYWRRGAARFSGAFLLAVGLCVMPPAIIMWLEGNLTQSIQSILTQSDWQPWKTKVVSEGFWKDVHWAWAYRMPVFIAYLALVATTLFWPRPKNLAHLIALSAAVVLGIQFWYADQGGVYVLWYLPFLLLLVFRPNLADRVPAPIMSENDWLARSRRALARFASRLLRLPEPTASVH